MSADKNILTDVIKDLAHKYHVTLNRKLPHSNSVIAKGIGELSREIQSRAKNWKNTAPKDRCYKPTVAINEKYAHNGKPCKHGDERTKNFCIKKLGSVDSTKVKWVRTLSPNKTMRITIACPK